MIELVRNNSQLRAGLISPGWYIYGDESSGWMEQVIRCETFCAGIWSLDLAQSARDGDGRLWRDLPRIFRKGAWVRKTITPEKNFCSA